MCVCVLDVVGRRAVCAFLSDRSRMLIMLCVLWGGWAVCWGLRHDLRGHTRRRDTKRGVSPRKTLRGTLCLIALVSSRVRLGRLSRGDVCCVNAVTSFRRASTRCESGNVQKPKCAAAVSLVCHSVQHGEA